MKIDLRNLGVVRRSIYNAKLAEIEQLKAEYAKRIKEKNDQIDTLHSQHNQELDRVQEKSDSLLRRLIRINVTREPDFQNRGHIIHWQAKFDDRLFGLDMMRHEFAYMSERAAYEIKRQLLSLDFGAVKYARERISPKFFTED